MTDKILIIRMLDVGDVCNTAVPLVRHFRKHMPDAELHVLTFGQGEEIIKLAAPDLQCLTLEHGWPDNILQAMESFLGLAERIIAEQYQQIINLDTAFMPCFLGRFLKDAGEPLQGNFMNLSVQSLIDGIQEQSLQPDYVSSIDSYMDSTWFSMARWHTPWWQGEPGVDHGYPEYYLRKCCEFHEMDMDFHIDINADGGIVASGVPTIAICLPEQPGFRPSAMKLKEQLENAGLGAWLIDSSMSVKTVLSKLAGSKLLVTVPGAEQWYATAVGCKTLVLLGDTDPRILMPDYATDQYAALPSEAELVVSVQGILELDGA